MNALDLDLDLPLAWYEATYIRCPMRLEIGIEGAEKKCLLQVMESDAPQVVP